MQFLHATPIRFGDRDQIIFDPHLLALLRQVPEQMRHVTADRADIGAFQRQVGHVLQLIQTNRAFDRKLVLVNCPKFRFLGIELVLNIAD